MPGITPDYASVISACAGICLKHHDHETFVTLKLEGSRQANVAMTWREPVAAEIACYGQASDPDVIRWAAECVAIRVIAHVLGLHVVEKSWRGTGFDFWLVHSHVSQWTWSDLVRLEVSGILEDNEVELRRRLREKLAQMAPTDPIMGYAAIVMFGALKVNVTERV
jgi:hypothetical protein